MLAENAVTSKTPAKSNFSSLRQTRLECPNYNDFSRAMNIAFFLQSLREHSADCVITALPERESIVFTSYNNVAYFAAQALKQNGKLLLIVDFVPEDYKQLVDAMNFVGIVEFGETYEQSVLVYSKNSDEVILPAYVSNLAELVAAFTETNDLIVDPYRSQLPDLADVAVAQERYFIGADTNLEDASNVVESVVIKCPR